MAFWNFKKKQQDREDKIVEEVTKKYLQEHIDRYLEMQRRLDRDQIGSILLQDPNPQVLDRLLSLSMAYRDAYMLNPTVAAAVNLLADSVSSIPLVVQAEQRPGEYTKVICDLNKKLRMPNMIQTYVDFSKTVVQHMLLSGQCLIWIKEGTLDKVLDLVILDPDDFDISAIENRTRLKYFLKSSLSKERRARYEKDTFYSDEIIHIRDQPDPKEPFLGIGRIQAAYRVIDLDSKIVAWWLETIKKGCRKDALISFEHDLTDRQYQRVKTKVEEQVAGFQNGRGFMILGKSAHIEFLNLSPAELDFSNAHRDKRKDILAIFRIPPVLLGVEDQQVFNGHPEARQALWLDNVLLICNNIAEAFTSKLLPIWLKKNEPKLAGKYKNLFIGYDVKDVDALLRQYFDRVEAAKVLVDMGVPLNNAADIMNLALPKFKGGDRSYISVNLVPAEMMDAFIQSKLVSKEQKQPPLKEGASESMEE